AVLLITHDRWLLESVSQRLLALDGKGGTEFYADLAQWESAQADREAREGTGPASKDRATNRKEPAADGKGRLSTREKQELDGMEAALEAAEARIQGAEEALADPAVATDAAALIERQGILEAAQGALADLYLRWEALENKRQNKA
ncbi:MAG TPA: ABC transporter ATP-binding protein, partial [bacterium]|nr:ABC transporter ATP-binding protein [bacterium]